MIPKKVILLPMLTCMGTAGYATVFLPEIDYYSAARNDGETHYMLTSSLMSPQFIVAADYTEADPTMDFKFANGVAIPIMIAFSPSEGGEIIDFKLGSQTIQAASITDRLTTFRFAITALDPGMTVSLRDVQLHFSDGNSFGFSQLIAYGWDSVQHHKFVDISKLPANASGSITATLEYNYKEGTGQIAGGSMEFEAIASLPEPTGSVLTFSGIIMGLMILRPRKRA